MNSVGATGSSTGTTSPQTSGKTSLDMTSTDFMNLFLAQLKHQDPTQPSDSSTLLQQMATMGSMSATAEMEQKMDSLVQTFQSTMGNSQVLAATQLIGKQVEVQNNVSPLVQNSDNSLTLAGSAMVPSAASDVKVTITDPSGKTVVRTIDLGPATSGGLMDFKWDGVSDVDGKPVPPGYYNISATATIAGKNTTIPTAGSFAVKSVALGSQGVIMNLDGIGGQDMGSIIKIL